MGRVMRDDTMRKVLSIRMNDKEMEMTKKYAGAKLVIKKPVLHTEFSPVIDFDVKQMNLYYQELQHHSF